MGDTVAMIPPEGGDPVQVPASKVDFYKSQQFTFEGAQQHSARVADRQLAETTNFGDTLLNNVASAATVGGSDIAQRIIGGEESRRQLARQDKYQRPAAIAGQIIGTVLPGGAIGKVSHAVESLGGKGIIDAAVRSGIEGGAIGIGSGIHELAQSDDLTAEHIGSVLSTEFLHGAGVGAVAGGIGKLAERGMTRASEAIQGQIANIGKASEVPAEIGALDKKGLDALEESHTAELETARKADRAKLAEDIGSYRKELVNDSKIFLATKDADVKEIEGMREIAGRQKTADFSLRQTLNNRVSLAERPQRALDALQAQQGVLEDLQKIEPQIRATIAGTDSEAVRAASLDAVAPTLEKNLALQQRIKASLAPHSSPTLDAIGNARDLLKAGAKPADTIAGKAGDLASVGMQGMIMHGVAAALPVPVLGHAVGAFAAKKLTDVVFGRLGKATAESLAKTAKTLQTFATVTGKVARVAPPLATAALESARFAPASSKKDAAPTSAQRLDALFNARSAEIRSQVEPGPTGDLQMRQPSRMAMADRLLPIRSQAPLLADKIETFAARRMEYLANALPKKPDMTTIGPDNWKPSEVDMRIWARKVFASQNPDAVEAHLASGQITPEEAEAYNACYPERAAALKQAITQKIPELRGSLPYARRLALSIFTGAPVDAAMAPNVVQQLQTTFTDETGVTQAQTAQPQFGSVRKSIPAPTPAQTRGSP